MLVLLYERGDRLTGLDRTGQDGTHAAARNRIITSSTYPPRARPACQLPTITSIKASVKEIDNLAADGGYCPLCMR